MQFSFSFLKKYKFTILSILYFVIILFFQSDLKKGPIISLFSVILIINILSKVKYSIPFLAILASIITFDAYMSFVYKAKISLSILASIFETNTHEAKGLFLEIILIGVPLCLLTFFLIFKSKKELETSILSLKKSLIILASFFLFIFLFFAIKTKSKWQDTYMARDYAKNAGITFQNYISAYYPLVYSDIVIFIVYRNEMHKMEKYAEEKRQFPEGVTIGNMDNLPEKIYFIMGESAWRKHLSLYGYQRHTTPFIDSLYAANPEILEYYNGISAAPVTRDALRIALSYSTSKDEMPFFLNYNIIDLANNAGYDTYWISNQDQVGIHDSYAGFISYNAKNIYFSKTNKNEDFNLIPFLKGSKIKGTKQFFFIHLYGSHYPYDGYNDMDKQILPDKEINNRLDEYDMTIHHTDRLMNEIYKIALQDSSFIISYISDHGEIINKGHGHIGAGIGQFEVPFLFINKSNINIDNIVQTYYDNQFEMVNTTNIIYIMSEIMGYKVSQAEKLKAIENGKYLYHVNGNSYHIKGIIDEKND